MREVAARPARARAARSAGVVERGHCIVSAEGFVHFHRDIRPWAERRNGLVCDFVRRKSDAVSDGEANGEANVRDCAELSTLAQLAQLADNGDFAYHHWDDKRLRRRRR